MSDGSLDMPEFGKPDEEKLPLVVPIVPEKKKRKLRTDHCEGVTKAGKPCAFPHQKDRPFCIQHDPAISAEQKQAWRKVPRKPRTLPMGEAQSSYLSREQILEILSKRLKVWMKSFGDVLQPGVDDAICDLARTYAAVAKVEIGKGAGEVRGWRMQGAG